MAVMADPLDTCPVTELEIGERGIDGSVEALAHVAWCAKISMVQLSTCWSLTEFPMRAGPPGLDGLPRSMIVL